MPGAASSKPATSTSSYGSYVNDGSRRAVNSAIWLDNTGASFPDWIEVSFNGDKTIDEIDVVTQQDTYQNPTEPTLSQTFSLYGITAFEVQYWNGSSWTTVPGGSVTGNNKVWRQFTFPAVTTTKVRVLVNGGMDNALSRVVEVEAWSAPVGGGSSTATLNWLVTDHLGTPRMIFDKTGGLAGVESDYSPPYQMAMTRSAEVVSYKKASKSLTNPTASRRSHAIEHLRAPAFPETWPAITCLVEKELGRETTFRAKTGPAISVPSRNRTKCLMDNSIR